MPSLKHKKAPLHNTWREAIPKTDLSIYFKNER